MRVTMPLVAASYNVHRCVGRDGVHAPERVASVLRELDADIVALQEVAAPDVLAELVSAQHLFGETMPGYGNAVLSRLPMRHVAALDLRVEGREPRGALHVKITRESGVLHVIAAHLGLEARERRYQTRAIIRYAEKLSPLLVLGDFNEWRPLGLRTLAAAFGRTPPLRTFPARVPLLPLDRIFLRAPGERRHWNVHKSVLARVASDHLPLRLVIG